MADLRFSDPALADLRDIRRYIAEDDPTAAIRFIADLVTHCERLAAMPEMGRKRPELGNGYRGLPLRRYLIVYRIKRGAVEVPRVVHGARNFRLLFR